MSTAQAVLNFLSGYKLKQEGQGRYRSNSPLRPGADSHSFVLLIEDDEHGAWMDHASDERGSLYDLAQRLSIETPRANVASTKRSYNDMADYAAAHGLDPAELERWMWSEVTYKKRPALQFMTKTGKRWRFLDGEKPYYISEQGYKPAWYGLTKAVMEAVDDGMPLVICNGEISVISAQAHLIPAVCVTAGEKGHIPDDLLAVLKRDIPSAVIIVALDCDPTGRKSAAGMATQLRSAGFNVRAVDLGLSAGGDLSDFCMLNEEKARSRLLELPEFAPPPIPIAPRRVYGLPEDKLIGHGRGWIMLHSDNLKYLPQVTWVLRPYIPAHGLVIIYGPSGTGKSFLGLWFALQIAQNKPVIYMAYEGEYGYQARIRAAQNHYGYRQGLTLTLGQVDLMSDAEFLTFVEAARKVGPGAIFVDTLARSMGDMDENSTRDMNIFTGRCNHLMAELDCSVVLVHHTNKGGSVERGSVVLRGAADVMIRLEDSDERVTVECAKTKDGKPFPSFYIRLHSVDTNLVDEYGQPVFTPVAVEAQDDDIPESVLTKHQRAILLQMELEIYEDDGMSYSQIAIALPQISNSTMSQALTSLKKKGYIAQPEKRGPYVITESGRDALKAGKPWQTPAEPTQAAPLGEAKNGRLPGMAESNKYHKAGM